MKSTEIEMSELQLHIKNKYHKDNMKANKPDK